jgi:recombination protein RecA
MKYGSRPSDPKRLCHAGDLQSGNSLALDRALGRRAAPRARHRNFRPESSGKPPWPCMPWPSQKQGGIAAFIDAEHALDTGYARKLGVNCDELLVSQPDTGEQALEIADMLVRSGAIDVMVIDSVAALVPRAEIEGEMGDSHMGLQARLMSQALRKLTGTIGKTMTTVIFINQIRMKIGVVFGNPETTTGGNALKFYASVRLDIRRIGAIKDGQEVVGNRTRVKGGQKQNGAALSRKRSSTSCTARASPGPAICWTSASNGDHRKKRLLVLLRRRTHRPGA